MYKYGLHLFTYTARMDDSALNILPRLKEIGFDGAEIPLIAQHLDLLDPFKVRKVLKELDMSCVTGTGITPEMSIISDDPDVRARGIEYMKRCIDMTAKMGATLIAGALYAPFGIRPQKRRTPEQWEHSVRSLSEIARYAAPKGITIGLEPLNRYEHFFINTADDAVSLIQDIGEPNVKLHLDTYHMNIEEKHFYPTIIKNGSYICHIHCSENDRGIPGSGHIDWDGLFNGLIEINYSGWLVIESFFKPIPEIADFTPIWRDLAPDPDTLAKKGLDFIRNRLLELKKK
jgi:D-psicose/D-tagatose/L-ribulose 3-epimerase